MKRITFVLALLLLCVPQFIGAQTIKVTGTVTSATEKYPLEGTGVMIRGTKNGVATDYNGQYVINVRKDAVLVFSSVGYKTVEIPVNGRSVINVAMEEDANLLTETIVVGYGTAKKISNVVGAAATVKAKVLQNRPVINAGDALQGQVAGLQVYSSSGDPSATVSMRLRGVNSIYASTDPLFILDGSPVLASVFSTLNANDIESVTILKDASSTAIYGSRAANGVVYITTKKGVGDKPTVKISANYGISNIAAFPMRMLNTKEYFAYREMVDPSLTTNTSFQALKNFRLENDIHTNWRKWILNQNAPSMGGDMTVSGRTNKTDYYISLNAFRQVGIEPSSNMNRYGARVNVNTKPTDWFKFGINMGLTYDLHHSTAYSGTGNSWYNPINISTWYLPYMTPYEILKDANGKFLGYGKEQNYMSDFDGWNWHYLSAYQPTKYSYVRLNSSLYEEFTPIQGLTIKFAQALEGYDYRYSSKRYKDPEGAFSAGSASESFTRFYRMTATNTIEYKFTLGENHNITALAGQESIRRNSEGFGASSSGQMDQVFTSVSRGITPGQPSYSYDDARYNSLFSRLEYNYAQKYFLDGSFRRDGSSLFGSANRYANFYSFGAMWDAKKENFLKNVSWLNDLKLKFSYGTIGNSGIDNYLPYSLVGQGSVYNSSVTWGLSSLGNNKLTWETQKTYNVGLDFRIFNFFSAQIEVYNKMTSNLLMDLPYSYSTGFSSGWANVGKMRNRGIEGTFTFNILQTRNTMLTLSVNASYNQDRIRKLFQGRDNFTLENYGLNLTVGHSYGEFYQVRYAGVDPASGKPLWYDKDGKITSVYNSSNAVLLGKKYSQFAPWAGGVQIDFSWKQFALQANFTGVFGKYMINNDKFFNSIYVSNIGDMNKVAELLYGTWTTPGQNAKYPKPEYNQNVFDSRVVENASFVRLKNITLSYTFSKDAVEKTRVLSGIRIYVTGRNLLTFTKYTGWDPEPDTNLVLGRYPNSRQISAGVEFTF
ncbi:MAG: TonB-dependent receptor [Bacteroidales bacterium]|jgi:TonB-linked SusC/RagA family outer membrane protein|nr:TonB-dependent receptor [Bacteroidales bacterium]MCI1733244.1 TonB-dependent receptor [Bacteroidales bacterium]